MASKTVLQLPRTPLTPHESSLASVSPPDTYVSPAETSLALSECTMDTGIPFVFPSLTEAKCKGGDFKPHAVIFHFPPPDAAPYHQRWHLASLTDGSLKGLPKDIWSPRLLPMSSRMKQVRIFFKKKWHKVVIHSRVQVGCPLEDAEENLKQLQMMYKRYARNKNVENKLELMCRQSSEIHWAYWSYPVGVNYEEEMRFDTNR